MLVYGTPIKALIHEKFGDGIMSMIDCKVSVDRKPDPKGDRVVLTFEYVSLSFCAYHALTVSDLYPQWEVPALPSLVNGQTGTPKAAMYYPV